MQVVLKPIEVGELAAVEQVVDFGDPRRLLGEAADKRGAALIVVAPVCLDRKL